MMRKETVMRSVFMLVQICTLALIFNIKLVLAPALPVHNINTGLNYASLQAAIDAPQTLPGHTLKADAGTYYENVVINKDNLQIIGENKATTLIDGKGMNEAIYSTASHIKVSGFTIRNGYTGIYLDYVTNNTFLGNIITANWDYGLSLNGGSNNIIIENKITQNYGGIMLWGSDNNKIYHNNIINNEIQVYSAVSNIAWDNSYPSGGNYWSDYTGQDTNNDGLGETPYVIDESNQDNYPLINQWIPPDVAATNAKASKTIVGQGFTLSIDATAQNQGNKIELFNLQVYANSILIDTKPVTLLSGASTIKTFTWDTTSYPRTIYTVSAYAVPLSGETDLNDNRYVDGTVMVTLKGDVNGDKLVDLLDLILVARAYGSHPGDSIYSTEVDLNDDSEVNVLDLVVVSLNYGQRDL